MKKLLSPIEYKKENKHKIMLRKSSIDFSNVEEMKHYLLNLLKRKRLEKSRDAFPVGTIRTYKDGTKHKKMMDGKWRRIYEGESKGKNISVGKLSAKIKRAESIADLVAIIEKNMRRFYDAHGKTDQVVGLFLQYAKERRKVVGPKITGMEEKKKATKSLEDILNKEPLLLDYKVDPVKDDKTISNIINEATPENRNEVQAAINGFDPNSESEYDEMQKTKYEYKPEIVSVADYMPGSRNENLKIAYDYTEVISKNISLIKQKDTYTKEKPSYIPEMNGNDFAYWRNRVVCAKISENKYLVQLARKNEDNKPVLALVTLDVLCAMQDFYMKKAKEQNIRDKKFEVEEDIVNTQKKLDEAIKKIEDMKKEGWQNYNYKIHGYSNEMTDENKQKIFNSMLHFRERGIEEYKKVITGETKYKSRIKAPRLLSGNKMTQSQVNLIYSVNPNGNRNTMLKEIMDDMGIKTNDMKIQFEDLVNTYSKGEQTSYGDTGLKDDLLKHYGIKIKRQNGDVINESEILQIQENMDSLFSVFGERASMSRNFGLKISHSGNVLMHARKACGIFFPYYKVIGVSAKGTKSFGFTLAHEFGHFMDYYIGSKKGHHFASDDYTSLSGQIASTFRKNMIQKNQSDYYNRTTECFARAINQYYGYKQGSNASESQVDGEGAHPTDEVFKEQIAPLIETWLKENNELLKSVELPLFNF